MPGGNFTMHWQTMESGLVTLTLIVGTLISAIGIIPLVFFLSGGGEPGEPKLDSSREHHGSGKA